MFRTLAYLFNRWFFTVIIGKPSKRVFNCVIKMLYLDLKTLFLTGYTIDELNNKFNQ
jgi:hypothetical protein